MDNSGPHVMTRTVTPHRLTTNIDCNRYQQTVARIAMVDTSPKHAPIPSATPAGRRSLQWQSVRSTGWKNIPRRPSLEVNHQQRAETTVAETTLDRHLIPQIEIVDGRTNGATHHIHRRCATVVNVAVAAVKMEHHLLGGHRATIPSQQPTPPPQEL